jgi:hypothetical protein
VSNVQRATNKSHSGQARVDIDGQTHQEVFYLFHDNFRSVRLGKDGKPLTGTEAKLYLKDRTYRLKFDKGEFWKMLDSFIS